MQTIIPRIVLLAVSVLVALFAYAESVYYQQTLALGVHGSDVRTWMWVFRCVTVTAAFFAIFLGFSLVRRLFP